MVAVEARDITSHISIMYDCLLSVRYCDVTFVEKTLKQKKLDSDESDTNEDGTNQGQL